MTRKNVVDMSNYRPNGTITAEEQEMQRLVQEKQKEMMTQEKEQTQCSCGNDLPEMELDECAGCGISCCSLCGLDDGENMLCSDCARALDSTKKEEEERETTPAQELVNEQDQKQREENMMNKADFVRTVGITTVLNSLDEVMSTAQKHNVDKVTSKDGVTIARQTPNTNSIFGLCVKLKVIKPEHVYWAFRVVKTEEGTRRQWLAILCDTGRGRGVYVEDPANKGRKRMIELTSNLITVLKKKGLWKRSYNEILNRGKAQNKGKQQ